MQMSNEEERRSSWNLDCLTAHDFSKLPINIFGTANYAVSDKSDQCSNLSGNTESSQLTFENLVMQCFKNQNCITDLNPRFMVELEKCDSKFKIDFGEAIYLGIVSGDTDICEIPNDCVADQL